MAFFKILIKPMLTVMKIEFSLNTEKLTKSEGEVLNIIFALTLVQNSLYHVTRRTDFLIHHILN